jgi:hypothetical protein
MVPTKSDTAILYALKDNARLDWDQIAKITATGTIKTVTSMYALEDERLVVSTCDACKDSKLHKHHRVWWLNLRGSMLVDELEPDPDARAAFVARWRRRTARRKTLRQITETTVVSVCVVWLINIIWFDRLTNSQIMVLMAGSAVGALLARFGRKVWKNRDTTDKT